MTYQKQNFADGQVLKAEHLNHMEDGIEAVTNKIPAIGANGNWYIGTEDSGVSATGRPGKDGQPGSDAQVTAANIQAALGYTPAATSQIPTDEHINDLINAALGVIEDGTY